MRNDHEPIGHLLDHTNNRPQGSAQLGHHGPQPFFGQGDADRLIEHDRNHVADRDGYFQMHRQSGPRRQLQADQAIDTAKLPQLKRRLCADGNRRLSGYHGILFQRQIELHRHLLADFDRVGNHDLPQPFERRVKLP